MKLAIVLILPAYFFVCYAASSVVSVQGPHIGPMIPPQKIGSCTWQACVTDKSVCFCMPSLLGVPQIKCNPVQNPKQDVFPKCLDVMLG